ESGPGAGSVFTVRLPVAPAEGARAEEEAAAAPASGTESRRILVVDDEDDVAALLADALRMDGHSVEVARGGRAALQTLAVDRYDLIVSDVKMPGLDGPALYRALARVHPALADRFVFVTGDTLAAETGAFLQ